MLETDPFAIIGALATALGLSFLGNIFQKIRAGDLKGAIKEAIANKDAILNFFDYNSSVNTAPAELIKAEAAGRNFFSLTDADRELIYSTCASPVERQMVDIVIADKEAAGTYEYKLETTGATYLIQQGWIASKTPNRATVGTAQLMNADGQKVGAAEVLTYSPTGHCTQADVLGKTFMQLLKITDYGQIVLGAFCDGEQLAISTVTGTIIGSEKTFAVRMPQYADKLAPGEHELELRQGRYAGHDDVKGDTVEWIPERTFKWTLVVE